MCFDRFDIHNLLEHENYYQVLADLITKKLVANRYILLVFQSGLMLPLKLARGYRGKFTIYIWFQPQPPLMAVTLSIKWRVVWSLS